MNVNRGIRQFLESLQSAGVEHLARPSAERVTALRENLAGAQAVTVDDSVPDEPGYSPSIRPKSTEASAASRSVNSSKERSERESRADQLLQLCAQVESCTRCPKLVANRSKTVFGVGNPNARICFFGEGPGADEDRKGEPFVGAAGQLLDKIIAACKMNRSDVYILNTVKCRPPGNRNPDADEIANCRPFFEQQLEIIQPQFIVCLGKVAANSLLDNETPVGRLRGRFHRWRSAQVIATYHPAYLLRNASAKKLVWEDMKMLLREAGIAH